MTAKLYITDQFGKTREQVLFGNKDDSVENEVLNIYEEVQYQKLEGFGGALTDGAAYVFSCLSKEQKEKVLSTYFDEDCMGYNQVRIHMDSCDFCTHMYEANSDEEDENLEKFSFEDTERYVIPFLKEAEKRAGKKLKIMLSAWSPPAYMKTSGQKKKGGSLKPEYRARWAQYMCRYVEEFTKRGYEVVRMSCQNEPKAEQEWESCVYTAKEEQEFLRDYLAPALKKHGFCDIELFIWDHNKERVYERAKEIIDESCQELVAGIAFHWYSGDHFEALDLFRQMYPKKKLILSESCLEFGKYDREDQLTNAKRLAHDMIGNLNHGMVGFYDWNVILDSEGGPNHVGNFCDAPFLYDMDKGMLMERRCLKYYWHFMHFIKPFAVRVATTKYTDKLDFTAWKNADGQLVFVLLNKSGECLECHLRFGGEDMQMKIEAHTIISGQIMRK